MIDGSIAWVLATNLVIWTGLFLYLLKVEARIRNLEKEP